MSTFSWTGPRSLNEIIKKELLIGKSAEEVSSIWKEYHDEKVSATFMLSVSEKDYLPELLIALYSI